MATMIQLTRSDAATLPAYLAEGPDRAPGVVLVQEWWGLNDQIKALADRLAAEGFHVIVPDLYRGDVLTTVAEANHRMSQLNWADAATQDIPAALALLHAQQRKVAVMGFCMGGALTILSAATVPGMEAAVCFYGIPELAAADPAQLQCPLLCHFATEDDWCTAELVGQLEEWLQSGKVRYELHWYEAKHAFMNDRRPEVYNVQAATLAWNRSLEFLKHHLR